MFFENGILYLLPEKKITNHDPRQKWSQTNPSLSNTPPWLQKGVSVTRCCWDPRRGHIPNFPPNRQALIIKNIFWRRLSTKWYYHLPLTKIPWWCDFTTNGRFISWYPAETLSNEIQGHLRKEVITSPGCFFVLRSICHFWQKNIPLMEMYGNNWKYLYTSGCFQK